MVWRKPRWRLITDPGSRRDAASRISPTLSSGASIGNGSGPTRTVLTQGCRTYPINGLVTIDASSHAWSIGDTGGASPTHRNFPPGRRSAPTLRKAASTSRWCSTATMVTRSNGPCIASNSLPCTETFCKPAQRPWCWSSCPLEFEASANGDKPVKRGGYQRQVPNFPSYLREKAKYAD